MRLIPVVWVADGRLERPPVSRQLVMSSALLFVYHALVVAASESKSMFTYQDRVRSYRGVSREDGDLILSELAALSGRLERRLFAEQCAPAGVFRC